MSQCNQYSTSDESLCTLDEGHRGDHSFKAARYPWQIEIASLQTRLATVEAELVDERERSAMLTENARRRVEERERMEAELVEARLAFEQMSGTAEVMAADLRAAERYGSERFAEAVKLQTERNAARQAAKAAEERAEKAEADARRYDRLRVLGCAPGESKQLDNGTVLRFTNLDAFVDADLDSTPSRGEWRTPATKETL